MLLDIVLLHLVTSLAGQDDELADHVSATEVDARVGLAVALFLGAADSLAKGYIGSNLVENEV